jgi:hypothetical protein
VFLFFTKSDRDYLRAFGRPPPAGTAMTAVMEADQLTDGIKHIRGRLSWLAEVTSQAEKMLVAHKPGSARWPRQA